MNRFDEPSLPEILKYPVPTLVWQPITGYGMSLQSRIKLGTHVYKIALTLYRLSFPNQHQHALILDGSCVYDTVKYAIYKDKLPLIRTLMYSMDDYIIYHRNKGMPINGLTFGTSFLQPFPHSNILNTLYENLSEYYSDAQNTFNYTLNSNNLFVPFNLKLHFTQPLNKSNIHDIKNNNILLELL